MAKRVEQLEEPALEHGAGNSPKH